MLWTVWRLIGKNVSHGMGCDGSVVFRIWILGLGVWNWFKDDTPVRVESDRTSYSIKQAITITVTDISGMEARALIWKEKEKKGTFLKAWLVLFSR